MQLEAPLEARFVYRRPLRNRREKVDGNPGSTFWRLGSAEARPPLRIKMPFTPYTAKTLAELLEQIQERSKERFDATYFDQYIRLTEVAEALEPFVEGEKRT